MEPPSQSWTLSCGFTPTKVENPGARVERDREKEREQHKALQTLGAQLQDLMRNGLNVAVWFAAT